MLKIWAKIHTFERERMRESHVLAESRKDLFTKLSIIESHYIKTPEHLLPFLFPCAFANVRAFGKQHLSFVNMGKYEAGFWPKMYRHNHISQHHYVPGLTCLFYQCFLEWGSTKAGLPGTMAGNSAVFSSPTSITTGTHTTSRRTATPNPGLRAVFAWLYTCTRLYQTSSYIESTKWVCQVCPLVSESSKPFWKNKSLRGGSKLV